MKRPGGVRGPRSPPQLTAPQTELQATPGGPEGGALTPRDTALLQEPRHKQEATTGPDPEPPARPWVSDICWPFSEIQSPCLGNLIRTWREDARLAICKDPGSSPQLPEHCAWQERHLQEEKPISSCLCPSGEERGFSPVSSSPPVSPFLFLATSPPVPGLLTQSDCPFPNPPGCAWSVASIPGETAAQAATAAVKELITRWHKVPGTRKGVGGLCLDGALDSS
ncbi:uncharacterized protein LOC132533840 [Erinaceus europaeus]|uniref:Uncharacterized protein LOC132533840 n=1 Tax=Erinaceus europaeus TaxID=9365 RepID=A0ABM3W727_ERIEU|nr:uncharacterized protein LOC132533840 [Erinaceus europaeus]